MCLLKGYGSLDEYWVLHGREAASLRQGIALPPGGSAVATTRAVRISAGAGLKPAGSGASACQLLAQRCARKPKCSTTYIYINIYQAKDHCST